MQFKAAREAYAGTVDALVSFMYDCRFDASGLTTAMLSLALEYVYQSHPRFWRDFNMTLLIRALTLRIPDWRVAANTPGHVSKGAKRLLTDVADYVRVNAFDEANAEMLRALPVHMRPTDGASAFDWISVLYINFAVLIDCLIEWHKSVIVDYLSYNFPTRFSPEVRGRFY